MFRKQYIILLLGSLCVVALIILGPVPQDQNYHDFADQRKLWNVPNFLNVVTNLPFALVGFFGLKGAKDIKVKELRHIFYTLFIGFILVTLGSGYYHWLPKNATLVYDRIPITIILMSFFAFIIYSSINETIGYNAFWIFNMIGVISVIYWIVSEKLGKGDLRWYGMVQFFPIIAMPLILILYKPRIKFGKEITLIFLFFGFAKFCETFDKEVYGLLDNIVSGHSLKHLLMAAAGYEIVVITSK
ncbi:ceramidase domain-containing protein [Segetibacter koreensis]|uniref:ceramidase domain-containing protein n=1 Tax=Segetibacter koreensis TaxID=398037 RepID=UPI00037708D5|nr:ceramidase domain-containing protein [Segetibacter koreensis]